MKRLFTIAALVITTSIAAPTFANNWQWQRDQMKADQQRRAKCEAAKRGDQRQAPMRDVQKATTTTGDQPAITTKGK